MLLAHFAGSQSASAQERMRSGTGSSGGGGAYVCRDAEGKIIPKKVRFADLWEAEKDPWMWPTMSNPGTLVIRRHNESSWQQQLDRAFDKLRKINPKYADAVYHSYRDLVAHQYVLGADVASVVPTDFDIMKFPKGCPREGMLFYNNKTGLLEIDGELFENLETQTDIAAAWAHEAIYFTNRQIETNVGDHNTSGPSRHLNACLFSETPCIDFKSLEERLAEPLTPNSARIVCRDADTEIYFLSSDAALHKGAKWTGLISKMRGENLSDLIILDLSVQYVDLPHREINTWVWEKGRNKFRSGLWESSPKPRKTALEAFGHRKSETMNFDFTFESKTKLAGTIPALALLKGNYLFNDGVTIVNGNLNCSNL